MTTSDTSTRPAFTSEQIKLAVHYRDQLWSGGWLSHPEDERIDRLNGICTMLCGGDRKVGMDLAMKAIWA